MSCSPRRRIRLVTVIGGLTACPHPVGPTCLRQFSTSNGCQDHTVLPSATRLFANRLRRAWYPSAEALAKTEATPFVCVPLDRSQSPALRSRFTPDAAASTASHPASVTIAIRPSEGGTAEDVKVIWVRPKGKYFCKRGWTRRANHTLPYGPTRGAYSSISSGELIRHSITSSASARSVDGIFTSIARAVCRLIASVNRVGS
jgi:hypothetical protein